MDFFDELDLMVDLANCLTCIRKRAKVTTELQRITLELTLMV